LALAEAANAIERASVAEWTSLLPQDATEIALSPLAKKVSV
jgi:hypothetical protein